MKKLLFIFAFFFLGTIPAFSFAESINDDLVYGLRLYNSGSYKATDVYYSTGVTDTAYNSACIDVSTPGALDFAFNNTLGCRPGVEAKFYRSVDSMTPVTNTVFSGAMSVSLFVKMRKTTGQNYFENPGFLSFLKLYTGSTFDLGNGKSVIVWNDARIQTNYNWNYGLSGYYNTSSTFGDDSWRNDSLTDSLQHFLFVIRKNGSNKQIVVYRNGSIYKTYSPGNDPYDFYNLIRIGKSIGVDSAGGFPTISNFNGTLSCARIYSGDKSSIASALYNEGEDCHYLNSAIEVLNQYLVSVSGSGSTGSGSTGSGSGLVSGTGAVNLSGSQSGSGTFLSNALLSLGSRVLSSVVQTASGAVHTAVNTWNSTVGFVTGTTTTVKSAISSVFGVWDNVKGFFIYVVKLVTPRQIILGGSSDSAAFEYTTTSCGAYSYNTAKIDTISGATIGTFFSGCPSAVLNVDAGPLVNALNAGIDWRSDTFDITVSIHPLSWAACPLKATANLYNKVMCDSGNRGTMNVTVTKGTFTGSLVYGLNEPTFTQVGQGSIETSSGSSASSSSSTSTSTGSSTSTGTTSETRTGSGTETGTSSGSQSGSGSSLWNSLQNLFGSIPTLVTGGTSSNETCTTPYYSAGTGSCTCGYASGSTSCCSPCS